MTVDQEHPARVVELDAAVGRAGAPFPSRRTAARPRDYLRAHCWNSSMPTPPNATWCTPAFLPRPAQTTAATQGTRPGMKNSSSRCPSPLATFAARAAPTAHRAPRAVHRPERPPGAFGHGGLLAHGTSGSGVCPPGGGVLQSSAQLAHGGAHLLHVAALGARAGGDVLDDPADALHRLHDLLHGLAPRSRQDGAGLHVFHRSGNQRLDLARCSAERPASDAFAGHHRCKAAPCSPARAVSTAAFSAAGCWSGRQCRRSRQ